MKKFIEKLGNIIASHEETLKQRENDEWLKGYVYGLLAAKQEAIEYITKYPVDLGDYDEEDRQTLNFIIEDLCDALDEETYDDADKNLLNKEIALLRSIAAELEK